MTQMVSAPTLPLHARGAIVTALDVGTEKVCCLVASAEGSSLRVLGFGLRQLKGMKRGIVIDREVAAEAICAAVSEAEKNAGETSDTLHVAFSGGRPQASMLESEIRLATRSVGENALSRVLEAVAGDEAALLRTHPARRLLHSVPVAYSLDGMDGIRDPRGLEASRLALWTNVITVERTVWENLRLVLEPALDGRAFHGIAAPWASALAALDKHEKQQGAIVIDLGGTLTTLSYMEDSHLLHLDTLPVGGTHITNDIARGLTTSLPSAERIKVLHGHASTLAAGLDEVIHVSPLGAAEDSAPEAVSRSLLLEVIQPRVEEIFVLLRERLERHPEIMPDKHAVLVGGCALLPGIEFAAEAILGRRVRLADPMQLRGLAPEAAGPAFFSAVGALLWAAEQGAAPAVAVPEIKRGWRKKRFAPLANAFRFLGVEF